MFHKFFVLISFLVVITKSASPQANKHYKKDSLEINKGPVDIVELHDDERGNNHQTLITQPFLQFLFKDVRFDTNYIGGVNCPKNLLTKGYHRLKFNAGAENVISRFLNDSGKYVFMGNYKLLCFIKQLRFAEVDSIVRKDDSKKLYNTARIEIEAFLKSGDVYYPAFRFDTVASSFSARARDVSVLKDLLGALRVRLNVLTH